VLHIGIDVGSTTVKAVVIQPNTKEILFSRYQRHNAYQSELVRTFLNGGWYNTSEDETFRIVLDGDTWIAYDNNQAVSKGTWTSSAKPDAGAEGTITFTITQVETGKGWINLSSDQKKLRASTVKYVIDPEGNQITLSEKKLAADDPKGIWKKLEGVYIKGGSKSGGKNAGSGGGKNADGSSSRASKQLSLADLLSRPFISYIITGSGTSFTATKNGVTVGTANQEINDVINAIKTDANGSNAAIQFGKGESVLNIGSASALFDSKSGGIWGIIALSGKITSSASPAIFANSVIMTSIADISSTSKGGGSVIDNGGILIINSGTVSANSANIYGIRNSGGTLIINNGNVSPRGEGIHNESGSGKGVNVFINGGTVQSLSSMAIYNTNGCTVTITGGTVTSTSSETIYNSGGALIIAGGTVSGGNSGHAIWNADSGTVTMTGGTVSMINPNESYAAINNSGGCTVTITGGNILAPNGGKAISNESDGNATITSPPTVIVGRMSGI
jgi:hypothetical protein